jgi:transposase
MIDPLVEQVNLGRVNNQKFVSIPHHKLVKMLRYKAQLAGIQVREPDESNTSRCSFLDGALPQKQAQYAERRITGGLFQAADGTPINADVNVAYNIAPSWVTKKHSPTLLRG